MSGGSAGPCSAVRPRRLSSAIIAYHDINSTGFSGHIYFEDRSEPIKVDVALVLKDNEEQLVIQMQKIEAKMDDKERQFRTEQGKSSLCAQFGTGFDYLVQRLHCDLSDEPRVTQAMMHAKMIRKNMTGLQKELDDRGFSSEATSYHLRLIFTGLGLLEEIFEQRALSSDSQDKLDLLFDGFEKNMNELKAIIDEIDAKLNTPV
jgi:DNA-binding protein YbaB